MSSRTSVVVRTFWDNEKLHTGIGRPLYQLVGRDFPTLNIQAILADSINFSKPFLQKVINLIKANDILAATMVILNERLKSTTNPFRPDKNYHNIHRELLFLIFTIIGKEKLSTSKSSIK